MRSASPRAVSSISAASAVSFVSSNISQGHAMAWKRPTRQSSPWIIEGTMEGRVLVAIELQRIFVVKQFGRLEVIFHLNNRGIQSGEKIVSALHTNRIRRFALASL